MKQIVLGTAGHIDHGKTSLIKALTGVDTDRLIEEKRRGITIELGFASLVLPSGQRLGVVDVPGHEKFIKNMVAGATGIDIVAMVIAADEGVMPQTREHLDICTLLGVRHGLAVITKSDMVEQDWLDLVTEDIREFLKGTFLENAPIVRVSSTTGAGLDTLLKTLDDLARQTPDHSSTGLFRMPVDRVFSMRGFGTVATGTVISGRVKVSDPVMLYPSGVKTKVRGIQVHNESVSEATGGMRAAINFQGLEKDAVLRGEVVAAPGSLKESYMADARLDLLAGNLKPLKNRARVRFHTGTSEIMGHVILLDREDLRPGESALVQLRLDAPVAMVKDDKFVLRSYSPVHTMGGGRILNPLPRKHKRMRPQVLESLQKIPPASPEELVSMFVAQNAYDGLRFSELLIMTNLSAKMLHEACGRLLSQKTILLVDRENQVFVHSGVMRDLERNALATLSAYHEEYPLKTGMPKEEFRSRLTPAPEPRLFHLFLENMTHQGIMAVQEDIIRLASHSVSLGKEQTDLEQKILAVYRESGLMPPYFHELENTLGAQQKRARDLLSHLVQRRSLVKVKEDLYFDVQALEDLKSRLVDYLKTNKEISTVSFKEMTGASRKYVIPLLEWFDANKVTLRVGDARRLRTG